MKTRRTKKKCSKVAYKSPKEARAALKSLQHTGAKRFYKCPYCAGLYHLTSEVKK